MCIMNLITATQSLFPVDLIHVLYLIRLSGVAGATLGASFMDKAGTDKISAAGTATKIEGKAAQGASLTDVEKLATAAAAT